MKRKFFAILIICCLVLANMTTSFAATTAVTSVKNSNRYELSYEIVNYIFSNKNISTKPNGIIVATGNSPYDALSAIGISEVNKWPIIYVNKTYEKKALNCITKNYKKKQTVVLVGGTSTISSSFEKNVKNKGFKVVRYAGKDRYDTNMKVLSSLTVPLNPEFRKSGTTFGYNIALVHSQDSIAQLNAIGELANHFYNGQIMFVDKSLTNSQKSLYRKGVLSTTIYGSTSKIPNSVLNDIKKIDKWATYKRVTPTKKMLYSHVNALKKSEAKKTARHICITSTSDVYKAILGHAYVKTVYTHTRAGFSDSFLLYIDSNTSAIENLKGCNSIKTIHIIDSSVKKETVAKKVNAL